MAKDPGISDQIAHVSGLLQARLGVKGRSFGEALRRGRHLLPRNVRKAAKHLAEAEPLAGHPKLRLTLDQVGLSRSASVVRDHLEAIDLADRRKGAVLSMLGAISFNLLAVFALLIVVLVWRGYL